MPAYRIFHIEQDGQVACSQANPTFDDDAAAVTHAQSLIVGEAVEVWEGTAR